MFSGEFLSMRTIQKVLPEFVPEPIAWGTYASDADIHFFLCSFHDMITDELPKMKPFCANIAALHRNSTSPTGKFGFSVCTFYGNFPQDNTWTDTWEEFFVQNITRMFELEEEAKGVSLELGRLKKPLYEKVIPRLLKPLETGGRSIKPVLIYGDLWYGNYATDRATNKRLVYDTCCFYAHNECMLSCRLYLCLLNESTVELGSWTDVRSKVPKPWISEYHAHYPISAPVEDWDDRNALYGM